MFQQKITAVMVDGRELTATADQRDLAAAEAEYPAGIGVFTQVRFLAWSALSRSLQLAMPWDRFNKSECLDAHDAAPDEVEALDPTRPAASAESS